MREKDKQNGNREIMVGKKGQHNVTEKTFFPFDNIVDSTWDIYLYEFQFTYNIEEVNCCHK